MTAFPAAVIVPVHHDGWAHLTQSSADLEHAFGALGLRSRLQMLKPGVAAPNRRTDAGGLSALRSRHIGLKARSSSTSISKAPPPLRPWATRSVASCTVFARSALMPSERARPTKSILGSSSSIPT
jgi:hypothetical protein